MKVVILCGGKARVCARKPISSQTDAPHRQPADSLAHHEDLRPQRLKDFILCLGYKGEMIKDYFRNYLWNAATSRLRWARDPQVTSTIATTKKTGASPSPTPAKTP